MNNNKTLVANHFIFYYYFSHYTIYLFNLSLLYRMLKFSKLSHIKALDKNFELFYLTLLCNVLVVFSFIKLTSIIIFIYYIVFLSLCVILPLKLQDHLSVTTAASALFSRVTFLTKCQWFVFYAFACVFLFVCFVFTLDMHCFCSFSFFSLGMQMFSEILLSSIFSRRFFCNKFNALLKKKFY